jgi:hypothetical protein
MNADELLSSEDARRKALTSGAIVNSVIDDLGIAHTKFEGGRYVLKDEAMAFLDVSYAKINGALASNGAELMKYGYEVLRGSDLERFAAAAALTPTIAGRALRDAPQITIFSLRAFLAMAMMIDAGKAAEVRERVIKALSTGEKQPKKKAKSSIAEVKTSVSTKPAQSAKAISRAISIRQPYVEQILQGDKTEEYRSMPTTRKPGMRSVSSLAISRSGSS